MQFDYRQALDSDIETLVRFTHQIHCHEDDGSLATHKNFLEKLKRWLIAELNNSQSLIVIAFHGAAPVGFVSGSSLVNDNGFLLHPIKGVIQLLWVEPDYRGSAIAETLLCQVEACFRENQIHYVECTYTGNNAIGKRFWTKMGYKKSAVIARKFL